MKKFFTLLFFSALALIGCGEKDPVQTVDWYKIHDVERLAIIKKCDANLDKPAASPNCINAKKAANHLAVDKRGYMELAPINPLKEDN